MSATELQKCLMQQQRALAVGCAGQLGVGHCDSKLVLSHKDFGSCQ